MREKCPVALLLGRRLYGRSALSTRLTLDLARVLQLGGGIFLIVVCGRIRRGPVLPAGLACDPHTRILAARGCRRLRHARTRFAGERIGELRCIQR